MSLTIDGDSLNIAILDDFRGGMRMDVDPSKLGDGEYFFLSNGRNRKGVITPIKLPSSFEKDLPSGKYQGYYGAGSYGIVFIDGYAYFRNFASSFNHFAKIRGFKLDSTVDFIYAALVPKSTLNFQRQTVGDSVSPQNDIRLTTASNGSPVCLVCQDGINQPILIFPDGSTRLAYTFEQWSLLPKDNVDQREYIPIGKHMWYDDGILYIASPDGSELYRSVRGRPLDCVIAIDNDGNKLTDNLFKVEASRLSIKIDFDAITCIGPMTIINSDPSIPSGIFISTNKTCYNIVPNYSDLLYGQPTYRNSPLLNAGVLNQFSYIADLLGDSVLIDSTSIRSFNAARQYRVEGNNSPFFQDIFALFEDITQDITAAIQFDNYGVFAVNTIYGRGLLFYDTLIQKFISFDIPPEIEDPIKQLTVLKVNNKYRLFFITESNLYEALAGTETAMCVFYPKEWATGNPEVEQILNRVRAIIQNASEDGDISFTVFNDRYEEQTILTKIVQSVTDGGILPRAIPFGESNKDTVKDLSVPFTDSSRAYKVGLLIKWNCKAELRNFTMLSDLVEAQISDEEASEVYAPLPIIDRSLKAPFSGLDLPNPPKISPSHTGYIAGEGRREPILGEGSGEEILEE